MMDVEVIRLGIEVCVVIGSVAFAVQRIQSTTAMLNNSINNLKETVARLNKTIEYVEHKQNDHETRITVLETKVS